jgi:hypothetical protein
LRHFLDCAIVSSGDDTEATLRVFQLIAGVALATRTVHAMVDRATEFSVTLLDRVRSNSLLFLKQVIVAMSSPRSNQVQKSSSLSDDLENDDRRDDENAILDAISEALTFACTDKSKMVRQSAVNACQALLSLDSVESDVLQSVIWVSQHDPVARNRVAGIQALPLRAETVEVVVARVRDVSTLVRVAALRKLHKLDALDAELCAAIVQSGYTERYVPRRFLLLGTVGHRRPLKCRSLSRELSNSLFPRHGSKPAAPRRVKPPSTLLLLGCKPWTTIR